MYHPTAALLDYDGPTKRPKLNNGELFYLLPMDVINIINDWLIRLEHCETFKTVVLHIK